MDLHRAEPCYVNSQYSGHWCSRMLFMGLAYHKHVHYVYGLFTKKMQTHRTHMKKIQTHKLGTIAQINEVCCIHQVDYGLPMLLSSNRVVMS